MKTIFISLLLLVLAGCSNQKEKTTATGDQTTQAESTKNTSESSQATADSKEEVKKLKPGKKGKQAIIKDQNGNPIYPVATDNNAETSSPNKKANQKQADPEVADKGLRANFKDDASSLTDGSEKTIIYVGVFAQWNYDNGELYDGSYDTAHKLFVLCNSNNCRQVPINQIVFPKFGSCDSVMRDMVKVFDKRADGTINPVGKTIKIVGNKGVIQSNGVSKILEFDAPTMSRIKKAATYNKQGTYQLIAPPAKQKQVIFKPTSQKDFTESAQQKQMVQPNAVKSETPIVKEKTSVIPSQQREAAQPAAAKSITPLVEEKKSEISSQTYQKNEVKVQSQSSVTEQQQAKEVKLQAAPQAVVTSPAPATEVKKQQALFQKVTADTARAPVKAKTMLQPKTGIKVLAK
jgi:hypothetical protein